MRGRKGVRSVVIGALLGSAMLPVTAYAQDRGDAPKADREGEARNEILVTATKRSERITDLPFAITAIGLEEIQDRGAIDLRDMQYSVPGLNIQEQTPGAFRIQLRGINAGAGTGLPVVGIYVDEVGITIDQQQREALFPLIDLERVEVLRGPQGTLYGEGSMAGTIRYITRNPSLTKVDGYVEANVYHQTKGDIGYRMNGAISVPIVEGRVGLRVAGGFDELAGWIDYPQINREDANNLSRVFVRPKLYAELTDNLTVSLLYQYLKQTNDTDNYSSIANPLVRNKNELGPGLDESHLVNAIIEYDFGGAILTSSTGYQARDLLFNPFLAGFRISFDNQFRQVNQEIRLTSTGAGPIQYTVGGWYRNFKSNEVRQAFINGAPTTFLFRIGDAPVDSESYAIFGDVTWSVSDRFDLSIGGRYFGDERSIGSSTPPVPSQGAEFDAFSPRLSVRYEINPDSSVYATASKGFRSGGFNGSGTTFGPETLWNYEVGAKGMLLDGSLFFDFAAFYADYKDRQAQTAIDLGGGVFQAETRNVGAASGFGLEGAINARLGSGLELDATAAWNNLESDVSNVEVLRGERFDFVAAFTASLALSQRFALTDALTGMWRIDYQYSDPYTQRARLGQANGNVLTLQDFRSEPQNYINARLGVETDGWSVSVDVRNLLNEDALLFPLAPLAASGEGVFATPRSYGLTVRRNFGR